MRYKLGARVRIDIPDELDPDFRWHGEHGLVIDIHVDEVVPVYSVGLEDHYIVIEARKRDIRSPLDGQCGGSEIGAAHPAPDRYRFGMNRDQ